MIGSSDTKLKIHARLQPGTTRGSDISRAFLELAGTISTPASSLPLAPAFMPCAVWDPSSGLCLLPPHTVPGLGSLLCLFPLPSLGSQDSGPWPGPQGPAHLVQFFLMPHNSPYLTTAKVANWHSPYLAFSIFANRHSLLSTIYPNISTRFINVRNARNTWHFFF